MIEIKKPKNFDGIRALVNADEFDSLMYCLDYATKKFKELECENLSAHCDKVQRVLSTMSYFDTENEEVRIQIGFSELETITNAISVFVMPTGESENSFAKCIERPNTKFWTTKTE